jgi:mRNA interferase MazF
MTKHAAPKQWDIVWINAEPHAGHEYGGHNVNAQNTFRPMLVISSDEYNLRTGMIVGFPITHATNLEPPFQFRIDGEKIHGFVMLTGVLGYDYVARGGRVAEHVATRYRVLAKAAMHDIFGSVG